MQQDSLAPYAYVQIKTGCMMPDLSGAVKENLGEKSVSDKNEHTSEVEPKSTNLHQEDKKSRGGSHTLCGWFSISNFTGEGQKMAILGIHVLTPKTSPSYGLEMVPHFILAIGAIQSVHGPQRLEPHAIKQLSQWLIRPRKQTT